MFWNNTKITVNITWEQPGTLKRSVSKQWREKRNVAGARKLADPCYSTTGTYGSQHAVHLEMCLEGVEYRVRQDLNGPVSVCQYGRRVWERDPTSAPYISSWHHCGVEAELCHQFPATEEHHPNKPTLTPVLITTFACIKSTNPKQDHANQCSADKTLFLWKCVNCLCFQENLK